MIIDCILVMVMQLNIADRVFSKAPMLFVIFKIQNQSQEESHVSLEVEHLFSQVGCARSKAQYLLNLQNQKIFALDAD